MASKRAIKLNEELELGRPPYEPSDAVRQRVEQYAALGIPQEDMCLLEGIGESTLKKYYPLELSRGAARKKVKIAGMAFKSAEQGNVTMRIFLAKVHLGWREVSQVEHSGLVQLQPVINFANKREQQSISSDD